MRGLFPVAASGGHSSSRCVGLIIAASLSLVAEHRLYCFNERLRYTLNKEHIIFASKDVGALE